ncbi:MAG: J domain-containing protein [Magnetospiraceae bacterium]
MTEKAGTKRSFTVSCPSAFRDRVLDLAARRGVNAGDLARSILLVFPEAVIAEWPDPGEPGREDRETIVLQSGRQAGKPWRRKPRLQLRLSPGTPPGLIRRALALALTLAGGERKVNLEDPTAKQPPPPPPTPPKPDPQLEQMREDMDRLRALVSFLAFQPLTQGIRNRAEALHVLGFPPNARPDRTAIRARFRMLATVHHPDNDTGDHRRMSQLNAAMELLTER